MRRQLGELGGAPFVWLGASRRDGAYFWLYGARLTNASGNSSNSSYLAWLDSAPPDFWRDACVRVARSSAQGNWTTARCADAGAYICQIDLGSAPATPPDSPPPGTRLTFHFRLLYSTVELSTETVEYRNRITID